MSRGLGGRGVLLPLLVCVLLTLTVHCAPLSHQDKAVTNRPVTRTFQARPPVLRKALERVLMRKHFSVDAERSSPFHLQTSWLQDGRYRSKVAADLKPLSRKQKSELTLQILVEKKALGRDQWHPEDEIGDRVYHDLMDDVEMEIYRVIYDGS